MALQVFCAKCPSVNKRHRNNANLLHRIYLGPSFSPNQIGCSQSLCQNGGTCQSHGVGANCVCKPGFTGQRCELGLSNRNIIESEMIYVLFSYCV